VITIIIPTYNRAVLLQACIQSIITQYYEGLEVIIVDDHSTDDTKSFLQTLHPYDFIKIIYNNENYGVNYSRNRGIEVSSSKFILFIDSDDTLEPRSLYYVIKTIKAYPETTHFLFLVSDRVHEQSNTTSPAWVLYQDWVSGKVSGDFTHVVLGQTMKKYLFFETFRMFEHLNWLRVKKETSPQLMAPVVITQRLRGNIDSLTGSARLTDLPRIRSKFESEKLYYALYHTDLKQYNHRALTRKLVKTILLGVACNQKKACRQLLQYAGNRFTRIAGHVIVFLPPVLVKYAITGFSGLKPR
jgi:glycosyltransferase involved in cell wall biosynthesis